MSDIAGRVEILPVRGIGEIEPGADLADVIVSAAGWLRDGDIVVVTSKIVSKAEGRLVDVPESGPEREHAREAVIANQTARVVATRGHTRIVATHHGFVMASAGVDASNVERTRLVLLPIDPDASARALRATIRHRYGLTVGVIISDTMGRPWRNGLTDVALGAAGLPPIRDYRGEVDAHGNELHITQIAVADELASAAELVKGKSDQVPVAVVRGALPDISTDFNELAGDILTSHGPGVAALIRDAAHDLFSLGTAEARRDGLRIAAALDDAPRFENAPAGTVEPDGRAIDPRGEADQVSLANRGVASAVYAVVDDFAHTATALAATVTDHLPVSPRLPEGSRWVATCRLRATSDTGDAKDSGDTGTDRDSRLVTAGAEIHRLRCALAAAGLASAWVAVPHADQLGWIAIGLAEKSVAPDVITQDH